MTIQEIIARKRDGEVLSREELGYFVQGLVQKTVGEEQAAALLMAIYIRGLDRCELVNLTMLMADSGATLDLSSLPGVPVDKHSTGGVGDKLTLVAAPLAAAAGVTVAKMSGRGLGHTGGTIDKLEAITGFKTSLSRGEFLSQVSQIGLAVVAQSDELVPADKLIYDLRNRTATISSIPLIASSIMSKKLASGCPKILLDVTVGSGAFMKTREEAEALARTMVDIGQASGRETVALLTNMTEPLGLAIGNALEVSEAIATLQGHGPRDLTDLAVLFAAEMMEMAGLGSADMQQEMLRSLLLSGQALAKFREMVALQGGDVRMIDTPALLPLSALVVPIVAKDDGYVQSLNAQLLGEASVALGAGRLSKNDELDLSAGVLLNRKIGQKVTRGEALCWLHAANYEKIIVARDLAERAFSIAEQPTEEPALILGRIAAVSIQL